MAYKRWLVSLKTENQAWLEGVVKGEEFNGSDVINELIERARIEDPKKFKSQLKQDFYRRKIKELQAELKREGKKDGEGSEDEMAGSPAGKS